MTVDNTDARQNGCEVTRKMVAALEQLLPYERAALFLRDIQRLPLSAVADQLGCSIPEARLHIAKGRVKLLKCLEDPRFDRADVARLNYQ